MYESFGMGGVLVFKFSEFEIPIADVIKATGYEPLFGHRSGRKSKTHWLCYMKGVSKPLAQERINYEQGQQ